MATVLSSITAGTATATGALASASSLIKSIPGLYTATPNSTQGYQPQNPPDPSTGFPNIFSNLPAALVFHYEGENTATFSSDITDHFIETNVAIQDQISLKPVIITVHGFVGELNDVLPPALQFLQNSINTLTTIGSYVPQLTETALIAYNEAFAAYQVANNAANAAIAAVSSLNPFSNSGESVISNGSITSKSPNQNKQQTYFQQFYGYWTNRWLFTVQTPWAVFQNMAIQSFRAVQDAETRMISDFEVTFKQIQTASTSRSLSFITQGRLGFQSASPTFFGTQNTMSSISFGNGLSSTLGGP